MARARRRMLRRTSSGLTKASCVSGDIRLSWFCTSMNLHRAQRLTRGGNAAQPGGVTDGGGPLEAGHGRVGADDMALAAALVARQRQRGRHSAHLEDLVQPGSSRVNAGGRGPGGCVVEAGGPCPTAGRGPPCWSARAPSAAAAPATGTSPHGRCPAAPRTCGGGGHDRAVGGASGATWKAGGRRRTSCTAGQGTAPTARGRWLAARAGAARRTSRRGPSARARRRAA
jgi:hypothetical protein